MKKLLLFVSCCLFGICTKAQINLEHTFEGSVAPYGDFYMEQSSYPKYCYVKTEIDYNNYCYKVTIYNPNFSVQSEQIYYLQTPPTGYNIFNYYISEHFFNDDDNYEFLMIYSNSQSTNERYKVILYDQNKNIIKDFGSAYSVNVMGSYAYIINGVRVFTIEKYYENNGELQKKTEVYSINGVTNSPENIVETQSIPYPNPANEFINIPIEMNNNINYVKIYDINGRLIETKIVNNSTDSFLLNVTNYPSGIYIYECNGNTNRFIKQ